MCEESNDSIAKHGSFVFAICDSPKELGTTAPHWEHGSQWVLAAKAGVLKVATRATNSALFTVTDADMRLIANAMQADAHLLHF